MKEVERSLKVGVLLLLNGVICVLVSLFFSFELLGAISAAFCLIFGAVKVFYSHKIQTLNSAIVFLNICILVYFIFRMILHSFLILVYSEQFNGFVFGSIPVSILSAILIYLCSEKDPEQE